MCITAVEEPLNFPKMYTVFKWNNYMLQSAIWVTYMYFKNLGLLLHFIDLHLLYAILAGLQIWVKIFNLYAKKFCLLQ